MKIVVSVLLAVICTLNVSAESNYEDKPFSVGADLEALLNGYSQQAIKSLPHFNQELGKRVDELYYVTTRLQGEEVYEHIFVEVTSYSDGDYVGTIASEPMGRVKFSAGDDITVPAAEVTDWLIVKADGSEEGNLVGKAADLIRAGVAVVIYRMTPQAGVYTRFEVVSASNAQTKQEVLEVIPKSVVQDLQDHITSLHKDEPAPDDAPRFSYLVVEFPGWAIVQER